MSTITNHPALLNNPDDNDNSTTVFNSMDVIDFLLFDYNSNIHNCARQVVSELNEIMYYTYHKDNNLAKQLDLQIDPEYDYCLNLEISKDKIETLIEQYDSRYGIGKTYNNICENLTTDLVENIIILENLAATKKIVDEFSKTCIKKIYFAFDGVPSKAKMREQRNRKYIGTYINDIRTHITKKYKLKQDEINQLDLYKYRQQICTGTDFMNKIEKSLENFDDRYQIEISSTFKNGEGECKIINAIKNNNQYTNYCIMSQDTDMIIMCALLYRSECFKNKNFNIFHTDYQDETRYCFLDIKKMLHQLQKYYQVETEHNVTTETITDILFMVVIFGNDFMPKLEPLNISKHFDDFCKICVQLSKTKAELVKNNRLNIEYLINFFRLLNKNTPAYALDQTLNSKYNNYTRLCKQISLKKTDLIGIYHSELKPILIKPDNIAKYTDIIDKSFNNLLFFLKNNIVMESDIPNFYKDIHTNPHDSYMVLILPRVLRYPDMDQNKNPYEFLKSFIKYTNKAVSFDKIKLKNKLMLHDYKYYSAVTQTQFKIENDKLSKTLEPYRSIFKIDHIDLVSANPYACKFINTCGKYYDNYVKQNMTRSEIQKMAQDYVVGLFWFYDYNMNGNYDSCSDWSFDYSRSPLIDDIIECLEKFKNSEEQIYDILKSVSQNSLTPYQHYLYITPNEYTNANISPNLSDVIELDLIDGYGAFYINKCQIRWHMYETNKQIRENCKKLSCNKFQNKVSINSGGFKKF